MLKIHGTAGLPPGNFVGGRDRGSQRLEEMMDQFARRMGELRRVIEADGGLVGDGDGVEGGKHRDGPSEKEKEQGQEQEQEKPAERQGKDKEGDSGGPVEDSNPTGSKTEQ